MTFKTISALSLALAFAGAPLMLPLQAASAATFTEETPFSQGAFSEAQKAGKPILVHVTASWCSTCEAQKPIIDKLRAEPKFKSLVVFNVDFDGQKAVVKKLNARMQSTIIVYKGAKEEGRSAGQTQLGPIKKLVDKAI